MMIGNMISLQVHCLSVCWGSFHFKVASSCVSDIRQTDTCLCRGAASEAAFLDEVPPGRAQDVRTSSVTADAAHAFEGWVPFASDTFAEGSAAPPQASFESGTVFVWTQAEVATQMLRQLTLLSCVWPHVPCLHSKVSLNSTWHLT